MPSKLATWRGLSIEFDPDTHRYFVDGVEWPGVTTILKPITNLDHIPPAVLERARWFGQCVHRAVELHVKRDLDEAKLDKPLLNVLEQFRKAIASRSLTLNQTEVIVANPALRYCGTVDLVTTRANGETEIIDVKTGTTAHTVGPQTSAYAACFEKKPHRSVVYLTETSAVWQQLKDAGDFNTFNSCINVMRFREKHYHERPSERSRAVAA